MKELMMLVGVTLGRRYTKKEKRFFGETIAKYFTELGYDITIHTKQNAFSIANNMVIGNLETAKKVIVAAYDTPGTISVPKYRYYPFNSKRNLRNESLSLAIRFLAASLLFVLIYFLLRNFMNYELWLKVVAVVLSVLLAWISFFYLKGQGNPVNFNRNSASIALICAVAREYKGKDIAFVLLDQCVNSYEGLKALKEQMDGEGKEVLMLESLAYGEELVLVMKGKTNAVSIVNNNESLSIFGKSYEEISAGNNFMQLFPNMLYLASGDNENKQFVVNNSRSVRDCNIDMDRLETISKIVLSYMKGEQ